MAQKRRHPEDDLQRAVAQLLHGFGWLWWHTPNGGARNRVEAAILTGLGVRTGVPDVLVFEQTEHGFGLAIELKSGRNVVSAYQREVLAALVKRGWRIAVCRTLDEVIAELRHVRPLNGRRFQ